MRVSALFLFLCITGTTFAQRIIGFNLFLNRGTVTLRFTISPGPSCNGFTVLHSIDSLTYTQVGSDPGICGSTSVSEDKSFTHESPVLNRMNYYKVRLEPFVETSNSRSIFVTATGSSVNMLASPNPFYQDGPINLKVFNVNNVRLVGYIYNQYGKPVQWLDFNTQGDRATISSGGLENGVYVIWLTDGSQTFNCKVIVLR